MEILDLAKAYFNKGTVVSIAEGIGEEPTIVQKSINVILPAILAGIMEKASTANGAQGLVSLLTEHDGDSILTNFSDLQSKFGKYKDLTGYGAKILSALFGLKVDKVEEAVAVQSGISKAGASSLLNIAAPVLVGVISKHFKMSGMGVSGLVSLLMQQKEALHAAVPAGLLASLGFAGLGDYKGKEVNPAKTFDSPTYHYEPQKKHSIQWLLWVLGGLLLLGAFLTFRACRNDHGVTIQEAATEADSMAGKVSDTFDSVAVRANAGLEALGNFFKLKLPGGVELNVPELGIENKLVTFIEDSSKPVDKTTWFNFDRINFETGSAKLSAESREQTKNIAEILKAFPDVTLKIGGYTDNTGDPKSNLKLSQDRAEAVKTAIISEGIDNKRLDAEGYGDAHPVASNDTENGRSQNRRIAVRVTNK